MPRREARRWSWEFLSRKQKRLDNPASAARWFARQSRSPTVLEPAAVVEYRHPVGTLPALRAGSLGGAGLLPFLNLPQWLSIATLWELGYARRMAPQAPG